MQNETFTASNVKCGGCASAIEQGLSELSGVDSVQVDVASGRVVVSGSALDRPAISARLAELGYPEA